MNPPELLSTTLSIKDLAENLESTHSPNSARFYKIMLRRLREFNGSDLLEPADVDSQFIEGFSDYLTRLGMTSATVRQMIKFFRATLKPYIPREYQQQFRSLFASVSTKEQPWINRITVADIQTIADAKNLPAPLEKLRLLFLYRFFACGNDSVSPGLEIPQRNMIQSRFEEKFAMKIDDFARKLSEEDYLQGLLALSAYLGISVPLDKSSATDGWIAKALSLGSSPDIVSVLVPQNHPYSSRIKIRRDVTAEQMQQTVNKVANSVWDLKEHWYAIRCVKKTPYDVNIELINNLPLAEDDMFPVFIAPATREKVRKVIGSSPVEKILFFRTYPDMTLLVKKLIPKNSYLFCNKHTKAPSTISDSEMQTFMLLCRLAPETLNSYFPHLKTKNVDIPIGTTATVTDGEFSGQVGIVKKIADDRYTVSLVINTLGNLRIAADIPAQFLTFNHPID